jgi:hypothetical protein
MSDRFTPQRNANTGNQAGVGSSTSPGRYPPDPAWQAEDICAGAIGFLQSRGFCGRYRITSHPTPYGGVPRYGLQGLNLFIILLFY